VYINVQHRSIIIPYNKNKSYNYIREKDYA